MPIDVVGAAQQLVAVLKRHFLAVGNPLVGTSWTFSAPCPVTCASDGAIHSEDAVRHAVMIGCLDKTLYFRSLLTDDRYVLEAIQQIPPIAETANAVRDLDAALQAANHAPRLAHLFEKLCEFQWSDTVGISVEFEDGSIIDTKVVYTLLPLAPRVIEDLEQAIVEAAVDGVAATDKWSQPRSPAEWSKLFSVSWDTLKRRFKDGSIRCVKLSSKSYKVHVEDLPS